MMVEQEAEERRLAAAMEAERLKALDNYAARERQRREERLIGGKARSPASLSVQLLLCYVHRAFQSTCVASGAP